MVTRSYQLARPSDAARDDRASEGPREPTRCRFRGVTGTFTNGYELKAKCKDRHWRHCEQAGNPERAGLHLSSEQRGYSESPSTTASTRSSTKPMARPYRKSRGQKPCAVSTETARTTRVMMKQVVATSAISWPMDATCRTSRLAVACVTPQRSTKTGRS